MPPEFAYPVGAAARHGHLGAVRGAGRSADPNPQSFARYLRSDSATCRPACRWSRPGADGRVGAGRRARQPAVEQEPRDRRRPARRPHRRRAHAVVDADAARRRRHRPAHRLRQHRQSAAGPRRHASARDRHPRDARRRPLAAGAATADRKSRPLDGRHGAGRGRRLLGHPDSESRRISDDDPTRRGDRAEPARAGRGRAAVAGDGRRSSGSCRRCRARASIWRRRSRAAVRAAPAPAAGDCASCSSSSSSRWRSCWSSARRSSSAASCRCCASIPASTPEHVLTTQISPRS